VDVGRERATDGHVARAGGDRHEEAEGQQQPHERVETGARVDANGGRAEVEVAHRVEDGRIDDVSPGVLGRVSVGATEAARDDAAMACVLEERVERVVVGRRDDGGGRRRRPAPSREELRRRLRH
jgi:hypothetical protein